jgi:hypothetical protein
LDKSEKRPLYQKAEAQVVSSIKHPPTYKQGFVTILFGDYDLGKLRLYIEILNNPSKKSSQSVP